MTPPFLTFAIIIVSVMNSDVLWDIDESFSRIVSPGMFNLLIIFFSKIFLEDQVQCRLLWDVVVVEGAAILQ